MKIESPSDYSVLKRKLHSAKTPERIAYFIARIWRCHGIMAAIDALSKYWAKLSGTARGRRCFVRLVDRFAESKLPWFHDHAAGRIGIILMNDSQERTRLEEVKQSGEAVTLHCRDLTPCRWFATASEAKRAWRKIGTRNEGTNYTAVVHPDGMVAAMRLSRNVFEIVLSPNARLSAAANAEVVQ